MKLSKKLKKIINFFHKDFELLQLKNQTTHHEEDPEITIIHQEMDVVLNQIVNEIKRQQDPKSLFQMALGHMEAVDRVQFMLINLMEGLKNGDHPTEILNNYQEIGLIESVPPINSKGKASETSQNANNPIKRKVFKSAIGMLRGVVKKTATLLAGLVALSLKLIPELLSLKPSIGFVGLPIPMPVLSFTLEGKGISLGIIYQIFSDVFVGTTPSDNTSFNQLQ